jgi:hypothetical protein
MPNFIQLQLSGISIAIVSGFGYIFPEYPKVGLWIAGLMAVLFVIYLLKSGVRHALKMSCAVGGGLTFTLFIIHKLIKLF